MKLYYVPGLCSLAPHIALRETDTDAELVKVNLREKTLQDGADYLAVNPKGQVPCLQLADGGTLTEVAVLLQYIADARPGYGLVPAPGTPERYRVLEWLNFTASELHKGFAHLFRPTTPEEFKPVLRGYLGRAFAIVDARLKDHDHLHGDGFTIADAYMFTVLRWSGPLKVALDDWPRLPAYLERIKARPKVAQAMRAEGIS